MAAEVAQAEAVSDGAQLPAGFNTPDFDVAALTVDELREEMRRRGMPTQGSKQSLVQRLSAAIAAGSTKTHRLTTSTVKRKRPHTRKEPTRDEFDTDEEHLAAWNKWRQARDNNNLSVKRSRENQRKKKEQHESVCKRREAENSRLEKELHAMREKMSFLVRAVSQPGSLSSGEQQQLRMMILEEAAKQVASEDPELAQHSSALV